MSIGIRIVNVARGGVIDDEALKEALDEGTLCLLIETDLFVFQISSHKLLWMYLTQNLHPLTTRSSIIQRHVSNTPKLSKVCIPGDLHTAFGSINI